MKTLIGILASLFVISLVIGVYALFVWGISVLVSYLFGIDFGFWKSAAAVILLSIAGGIIRGNSGKKEAQTITQPNEEVTKIAELIESAPEPSRITIGISVKRSAELGPVAYNIAEFVNILREQTGDAFTLDIQAAVNAEGALGGRKAAAIGFIAEPPEEETEEDGEDDE